MAIIVPAVLPTSQQDLDDKLTRLIGIAPEVQIDVVDGIFAGPASWPYTEGPGAFASRMAANGMLPCINHFRIEMDLMVRDPAPSVGEWIQAGATRILAHVESAITLAPLVNELRQKYGHEGGMSGSLLSFGLALNVDTSLDLITPYLPDADYVQFMGIKNIGKQGQAFAPEVLDKIALFRTKCPGLPIQVDGGVNLDTAPALLKAGVSRLVVGSALWKQPDVAGAYLELSKLSERYGLYE